MPAGPSVFLTKAQEGLATANLALSAGHFSACARNAYFAAYHAAIAALIAEGVADITGKWAHEFVQAAFNERLITRRKVYPAGLRSTLPRLMELRIAADYTDQVTSRRNADLSLRRSHEFIALVEQHVVRC